jgi:malate dehydrogenase (oxaloacetate-decarboxylating)
VTVVRATRISEAMIAAVADAVAKLLNATLPGAPLLPPVRDLRPVSAAVAIAVAKAAAAEGVARVTLDNPIQQVHQAMWHPRYPRLEIKPL